MLRAAHKNIAWSARLNTHASESTVIELARAGKGNFVQQRGRLVRALWIILEAWILNSRVLPLPYLRALLLRAFGARIGKGCRLFYPFRVRYPWNLELGDGCWIGEDVWFYNQGKITVGSQVCISQGTFLTTGSHDAATNMDLRVDPICIEDGVWICSMCVVQKGTTLGRSALVTPLSVVHKDLSAGGVYGGNPCQFLRWRFPGAGERIAAADPAAIHVPQETSGGGSGVLEGPVAHHIEQTIRHRLETEQPSERC